MNVLKALVGLVYWYFKIHIMNGTIQSVLESPITCQCVKFKSDRWTKGQSNSNLKVLYIEPMLYPSIDINHTILNIPLFLFCYYFMC